MLSGVGDAACDRQAMQAVNDRLVREDDRLIMLSDPPFDGDSLDPGYIKGYLPGVHETEGNTHTLPHGLCRQPPAWGRENTHTSYCKA